MIRPAALSPGLALGWSLLLTFALVSVSVMVSALLGSSNWALVVAGPATLALMLPASKLMARFYGERDRKRALALRAVSPLELIIGASLGLILQMPSGYLNALVERQFPTPPAQLHAQLQALTPGSSWVAGLMLLSVALVVPFSEELFFRGALFGALSRVQPGFVATWTTSVAFALAHQEPRNWAPLLLVALVLGELRRLGGSIWAGVALHAAFNMATLLFVFVTRPTEVSTQQGSWQQALVGCALVVLGVWVFGRVSSRRLAEVTS